MNIIDYINKAGNFYLNKLLMNDEINSPFSTENNIKYQRMLFTI